MKKFPMCLASHQSCFASIVLRFILHSKAQSSPRDLLTGSNKVKLDFSFSVAEVECGEGVVTAEQLARGKQMEEEEEEEQYVYIDDAGAEQGPFPQSSLAAWVQAGHMDGDRMVRGTKTELIALRCVPELAQFLSTPRLVVAESREEKAAGNETGSDQMTGAQLTGAEMTGAPVPLSAEEALLSEYYRRYYEEAFARAAADYKQRLPDPASETFGSSGAPVPPEDGYQVPKPQFQEYVVAGKFAKIQGRFMAEGAGGSEYWAGKGAQVRFFSRMFRESHFNSIRFNSVFMFFLQHDREGRQLDHYYDVNAFNSAMAAGVVEKNAPDKKKAAKKKAKVVPQWMEEDPLEGAFK